MKKALVIFYSQAGQTDKAVQSFSQGLSSSLKLDFLRIEPEVAYPFPWKMTSFFRVFPKCIRSVTPEIKTLQVNWDDYDLIVLGYQVWFLSVSLPIQGFLKSKEALGLQGKKVITLVTCRNLWQSAHFWVSNKLRSLKADHLGQITLCETGPVWASFVTTPRWMLTGKKNPFFIFPAAGISDEEFAKLPEMGRGIAQSWVASNGKFVQTSDFGSNLNRVSLVIMDRVGRQFFEIWASIIYKIAPRDGVLQDFLIFLFRLNLIALIVFIGPFPALFEIFVRNSQNWMVRLSKVQDT